MCIYANTLFNACSDNRFIKSALSKECCYITEFTINENSSEAIYKQIAFQVKLLIVNGELRIGNKVPSVRSLSKTLSVSTLSAQRAYTELQNEGIIKGIDGKGSFVAEGVSKPSLKDGLLRGVEVEVNRSIKTAKQNGVDLAEFLELVKVSWSENG